MPYSDTDIEARVLLLEEAGLWDHAFSLKNAHINGHDTDRWMVDPPDESAAKGAWVKYAGAVTTFTETSLKKMTKTQIQKSVEQSEK